MRPPSKRTARIAGLSVAVLAVVGALLWVLLSEPRGPLINGEPVAYWARQLRSAAIYDYDAINTLANEKGVAIPALVQQLSLPDSRVKDFAKRLWLRLPPTLRDLVPEPTTRAELRTEATYALSLICEQGSLATSRPSLSEAQMILPVLTNALRGGDANVRVFAAGALGNLEIISAQAIDACEVALNDPHWSVRNSAVISLSNLSRSDKRAIPPMKSALTDSHPQVRKAAEDLVGIVWDCHAPG